MEGKDFFRRFSRRRRMEKDTAGQPRAIGPTGPEQPPAIRREEPRTRSREGGDTKLTDRFSRDLTRMAITGRLDPVVGREPRRWPG